MVDLLGVARRWRTQGLGRSAVHDPGDKLVAAGEILAHISSLTGISEVSWRDGVGQIALDDGRRFLFDPSDPVRRLYSVPLHGSFEPTETAHVRTLLRPGDVMIDVGASFGWYTILGSQLVGPGGRVHAFEPIPDTFAALIDNVDRNAATNVVANPVALSDTAGRRALHVPDIGVSGSFEVHDFEDSYETFVCDVQRLDTYVAENDVRGVRLLKADVEGAEFEVLRGAEELLRRDRPALFVEIQEHSTRRFGYEPADLFAWLSHLGYRASALTDAGRPTPFNPAVDEMVTHNYFFTVAPR